MTYTGSACPDQFDLLLCNDKWEVTEDTWEIPWNNTGTTNFSRESVELPKSRLLIAQATGVRFHKKFHGKDWRSLHIIRHDDEIWYIMSEQQDLHKANHNVLWAVEDTNARTSLSQSRDVRKRTTETAHALLHPHDGQCTLEGMVIAQ